jgi:hypothetical protein
VTHAVRHHAALILLAQLVKQPATDQQQGWKRCTTATDKEFPVVHG